METLAEPSPAAGEIDPMEILGTGFFDDDSDADNTSSSEVVKAPADDKGSSSSQNGKLPFGGIIRSPGDGPGVVSYTVCRQLAEIFSVRFLAFEKLYFEDLYGVILVDGFYSYVIFERLFGDPLHIDSEGYVRLTGPRRGVLAFDDLILTSCLFNSKVKEHPRCQIGEMWSRTHKSFDQFLSEEFVTDFGPVEVHYAVYRNSAEAILEVTLIDWEGKGEFATIGVEIFGIVTARNSKVTDSKAEILLFEKKSEEAICIGFTDTVPLPLSRNVMVLPLGAILTVDLCLWHRCNKFSMDVLVDKTVQFDSRLEGEEEKVVCGNRGKIKVKAIWKTRINWAEVGEHL